ncbi:hypothetical protein O5D80_001063 [Batrachochytrium dendrobatidis]|nr:hypothetical protein O5D80_001063 [Batrachochytrium dendrobatidis]
MESVQHDSLLTIFESGTVTLQPIRQTSFAKTLIFMGQHDGCMTLGESQDMYTPNTDKVLSELTYYGIVGHLDLGFIKYIFVVVDRDLVATNIQQTVHVWHIRDVKPIVVFKSSISPSLREEEHERICLRLIKDEYCAGNKYYSLDMDLANGSLSGFENSLNYSRSSTNAHSFFSHANDQYVWNKHMLRIFVDKGTDAFVTPIICGHVGSMVTSIQNISVSVFLISRINRHQAGARYWCRGVDEFGHSAIEVDTNVLVVHDHGISSFCMIRGSVPLFWNQKNVTEPFCEPPIDLSQVQSNESMDAMSHHFEHLLQSYGQKIYAVDLLNCRDHNSDTAKLSRAYEKALIGFHGDNVAYLRQQAPTSLKTSQRLMRILDDILCEHKYNRIDDRVSSTVINCKQQAVIRFNSLDCVDEVSLAHYHVSSYIFRQIMCDLAGCESHLQDLNVDTDRSWRKLWIDNSNMLSQYYTGTPMICTHLLSLEVGWTIPASLKLIGIWLSRKYMGHFQDFARQDGLELFMGNQDDHRIGFLTPQSSKSELMKENTIPPKNTPDLISQLSTSFIHLNHERSENIPYSRSFVKKDIADQINLRQRLTYHELSQPWHLSIILVARKFTAPRKITTYIEFVLAVVWLFIYTVSAKIFGYYSKLLIRRPRKDIDQDALPVCAVPPPHGIAVKFGRVKMDQFGQFYESDMSKTHSFSPSFGSGR